MNKIVCINYPSTTCLLIAENINHTPSSSTKSFMKINIESLVHILL